MLLIRLGRAHGQLQSLITRDSLDTHVRLVVLRRHDPCRTLVYKGDIE